MSEQTQTPAAAPAPAESQAPQSGAPARADAPRTDSPARVDSPARTFRSAGDRASGGDRARSGGDRGGFRGRKRRKVCKFCTDKAKSIDYKDSAKLRFFLSERSKILPRRVTGTCAAHQRMLNEAIKRARHVALLPFTTER